jgi:NADPH2:quinone reductase
MRAYTCNAFGPLDTHGPGALPAPQPADDEVIIDVAAAGVNYYDTLIVQGKYQIRPGFPFSPGGEFAGTIAALGVGVTGFQLGQRVLAFNSYGGYAERARARARQVFPLPDAVSFDQAAAALVAYATAWFALYDRGRLKAGGNGVGPRRCRWRRPGRRADRPGGRLHGDCCRQHRGQARPVPTGGRVHWHQLPRG